MSGLRLRGLRAGNLRNVDLDLQRQQWTALHGASGAGKSALLFGVLEPVARRRFRLLRDPSALPGGGESWLAGIADAVDGLEPVVSWAGEVPRARRRVGVGRALDLWPLLAAAWTAHGRRCCPSCAARWRRPEAGALAAEVAGQAAPGEELRVLAGAGGSDPAALLRGGWTRAVVAGRLVRLEEAPAPLPAGAWLLLDRLRWRPGERDRLEEALGGALRRGVAVRWQAGRRGGELPPVNRCPACGAEVPDRPPESLAALREAEDLEVAGRRWSEWARAPLESWRALPMPPGPRGRRGAALLGFLARTGLGHLDACRPLGTLSLGEARRLELVSLLAQVRRNQLVLFDEPGLGLHGQERKLLAGLLRELVRQGNTVLTADPAREFLEAADAWVLLGPGGGPDGGRVVDHGGGGRRPASDRWRPPPPAGGEPAAELSFRNLRARFLDIPELSLPLGRLVAVAGVSGSGKSTLLEEEIVPRLRADRGFRGNLPAGGVAVLLERALGHAAFSTIATLAGIWREVRDAFAGGEEGRILGLQATDLVARPGAGGCPDCRGHGCDADGLPCASCEGLGLREDLLELRLRGRSLRDWLTTPLVRLERRVARHGRLRPVLQHLVALGLGSRRLGERGRHLSLGERSRIALARALARARSDRPRLFLLDEPCLGLPVPEALAVVELLRSLRDQGHSFLVVDHHEVLLRSADHLLELGPGAGPAGGRLLFSGPPAALLRADTPTGRWLRSRRRRRRRPPPPSAQVAPESAALSESLRRAGRTRLEEELLRELATRSPLVADALGAADAGAPLPPTAWPGKPPAGTTLLQVLGLQGLLEEAVTRFGRRVCARCSGAGPWQDLPSAARRSAGAGSLPPGRWLLSTPLLPGGPSGATAAMLLAAGFRRLLRRNRRLDLRAGEQVEEGDEVWLDRLDPGAEDATERLREVEHHAGLIGGGEVRARAEEGARVEWVWRSGACRSCGAGGLGRPAPMVGSLGGETIEALQEAPLGDLAAHLRRHAPVPAFEDAASLLRGSSLLHRPASVSWTALTLLERRLARLAGFLLFPLRGVVLLHDQPLAGLPPALARRLAAALLDPARGIHRFTDAEGWATPAGARTTASPLPVRSFALDLDPAAWAEPAPAPAKALLGDALGLVEALASHFLRSEEARLRGLGPADLARGGPLSCPACRGRAWRRPHPAAWLRCPACDGSGWSPAASALEDRELRWSELWRRPISELAEFFAGTPALARPLAVAGELGLGGFCLAEPMARLPLGARSLAPLAGVLAAGGRRRLRLLAPAAGLAPLEARRLAHTLKGYLSDLEELDWRDHHPALQGPTPARPQA